jgi:pimeloyl-ACP methyl ester carboxylesterase
MAADYVAQIRTVQPAGPYHLVGWSFGGNVVHEMAVQLRDAGEEIAALVVLDSYPELSHITDAEWEEFRHEEDAMAEELPAEEREACLAVIRNNTAIHRAHRTRVVDTDAVLITTGADKAERWAPHITGETREYKLAFAHQEMLLNPEAARQVAQLLGKELGLA